MLDVAALRRRFPQLADGTAYFDGPGGTQTPDVVAEAIARTLLAPLSNRGTATAAARNAEAVVVAARAAVGDLLGTPAGTVVFGRSATQLTLDLARTLARTWGPGDEVVVTRLDHDANVRPWLLAAEQAGATVRWVPFDRETGELRTEDVAAVLGPRTRLVAVTGASNLLGTVPDLPAVSALAHEVGALVHVDGVHLAAHVPLDVPATGADTFTCSPYKFLGPHLGVLTGRAGLLESLRPDKLLPSSDAVPERFELGTLPYELLAGTTAAVDLLAGLVPGDGRPAAAAARVDGGRGAARGPAAGAPGGGSRRPRRHGAVARPPTDAHPAVHVRRAGAPPTWPRAWRRPASTRRPATSTPSRPRAGSASATRAACGRACRRTPTTPTWTGCWGRSPTSSAEAGPRRPVRRASLRRGRRSAAPASAGAADPPALDEGVHQPVVVRVDGAAGGVLVVPGDDLAGALLEGHRAHEVRDDLAQLGGVEHAGVRLVAQQARAPLRSASAMASEGTWTMRASVPAAAASAWAIWSQVRTSSEMIWNASPSVRGWASRGTNPLAKSVWWVSVHSDEPSPCTTTSLPCRIRSTNVQPASKGTSVRS